ncbi:hypothetical protein BJ742DRAFT_826670 [Cladochytrium replicatum]|nr:hypothetical protein BJ742DRAFT_826670 [Cladochytrium replicatum]
MKSFLALALLAAPALAWAPTSEYIRETYRGRNILFHNSLNLAKVRTWVQGRLDVISDLAIPLLDGLPTQFWVDPVNNDTGSANCAMFHPPNSSVRDNINPEKLSHIAAFASCIDYTDQPAMFLHELAHAFESYYNLDATIQAVWVNRPAFFSQKAYRRGLISPTCGDLDTCAVYGTRGETHYGDTNKSEYFAELTEAYFGVNDFYPYTRPDLCRMDPAGCSLLENLYQLAPNFRPTWGSLASLVPKSRMIWAINNCNEPTTVYWLDYEGVTVVTQTLAPGGIAQIASYEGHRFKFVPSSAPNNARYEQVGMAPRQVYYTCAASPVDCARLIEPDICSAVASSSQKVDDLISCPLKTGKGCTAQSYCTDNNAGCATWGASGECTNNSNFMLVECRLSCKSFGGCVMG